jgi:hypothetical protein
MSKKGGITGKGFKPGQSGNPSGRPKTKKIIETLKELSNQPYNESKTKLEHICDQVIEKACGGDISMIKLFFERLEGKPFMNHNIAVEKNDEPIRVFSFEPEFQKQLDDRYAEEDNNKTSS